MFSRWKKNKSWRLKKVRNIPEIMGVYLIICGDDKYVGASKNIKRRISDHLRDMSLSPEHSSLYYSLEKYGEARVTIKILERVEDQSLLSEREKYWQGFIPETINKETGKHHRDW